VKTRRRQFLAAGAMLSVTTMAATVPRSLAARPKEGSGTEEISLTEDLMREHGVLRRILLVYGEAVRRLATGDDLPPRPVADAAAIVRSFVEDYHEKLEEDYIFPRFKKAGRFVDLADVLLQQHEAGRRLTDVTLRLSTAQALRSPGDRQSLAESMRLFVRMYSPHAAREDTVLFPALRQITSPTEYGDLGEDFERREHERFGNDGFEKTVGRVAAIEKTLGIYDLSKFTAQT
jgi:hemerythrin-like domain-containing protein